MRTLLTAVSLLAVFANSAYSMEYPGTCRGPSAVVTSISGQDTRYATVVAKQTKIDAEKICRSEYASGPTMQKCMSDALASTYKAEANCFTATLVTSVSLGSKTTFKANYKFPVDGSCGDDNNQAIQIFHMLCPAYRYDVEKQ